MSSDSSPGVAGRIARGLAVALVMLAATLAVSGTATASPSASAAAARCALVTDQTLGGAWSSVRVVRTEGLSCATARTVVARCIDRRSVRGWSVSDDESRLRSGRRTIVIRVAGSEPACLHDGPGAAPGAEPPQVGLKPNWSSAGPYEMPYEMPPGSPYDWYWIKPVATKGAYNLDVGSVTLNGVARTTGGDIRSAWFEYGTTRDVDTRTRKLNPKVVPFDRPSPFEQQLHGLQAKTRYYWRAVVNVDEADGGQKVHYGALGSFVTQPYRKISGAANPCQLDDFNGDGPGVTELTESLAIVCSRKFNYTNSNITVIPTSVGYSGKLSCPAEFPRNLNSGDTSVTIPKIDYVVSVNNLVNYWRSNGSARFTTFPGYQKNFAGHDVGPVPGWHEWNIDQWNDGVKGTSTDIQFWINCTDNWKAISADALAAGEGDDTPSKAAPSEPRDFTWRANGDGYSATWKAPATATNVGIAGYQLNAFGVRDARMASVFVNTTATDGTLPDSFLRSLARIYRTKELYAQVAAISREGVRGPFAVIPFTLP